MGKINPQFFRIKNWDSFQHYRDRNPKWVKLHFETLFSRDWLTLDDHGRALMIVCMLVGSRHNGQVPNDANYLARIGHLNGTPCLNSLVACGFLEPPKRWRNKDNVATKPLQNAIPEKESEIEKKEVIYTSAKKPKTSMPEIWPTDIDRQWALNHWREKGREDLCGDVDEHMAEARHHHSENETRSGDWPGSWRTWAQRAVRYNRRAQNGQSKPRATDNHLAGIASLIADGRARRQQ